ncbi:MAG: hypothetical protein EBS01_08080, partial [Verrucomicrobia bacterium]|nr:hypothetical protein [Verrucomicrobiota bacterium]
MSYQWRKDGVALSNGTSDSGVVISGANSEQLVLENVGVSDEGGYDVVVSQLEDSVSASATSLTATVTVDNSIKITTNPAARTVMVGEAATFSVSAVGKTLKYQWRRNGVNLADGTEYSGATAATLTVRAASAGGDYDVVISSGALSVASQSARLEAIERLRLVADLASATALLPNTGERSVTYTLAPVLAGGGTYTYQWQKNGVNIAGGSGSASQLSVVATDSSAADGYRVVVSSSLALAGGTSSLSLGSVTSSEVRVGLLAPVSIETAPEAVAADVGGSVTLSVVASGGGTLAYQWEKLGTDGVSSLNLSGATSSVYTVADLVPSDAGSYRVKISNGRGAVYSKYVTLTVRQKDFILKQPVGLTVNPGDSASFGVTASGSNLWTLSYQWRKGGSNLADNGTITGSTSAKLTVSPVSVSDDGSLYEVVVTGTYGGLTSSFTSASARLGVNRAVSIDTQPSAPLLRAGGSATMFVRVSGTPGFSYQWRKNGAAIADGAVYSGATAAALTLNAPESNASALSGIYDVVVSNVVGSVTSNAVSLSLLEPVSITANPVGGSFDPYSGIRLSVSVTGSAPLSYQWFKNGVAVGTLSSTVSGGTSDTLFIASADPGSALTPGDGGSYEVMVSNSLNSVTSLPAVVEVKSKPVIMNSPTAQTVNSGDGARFSVEVKGTAPFTYRWHKLSGGTVSAFELVDSRNTTNELALSNVTEAAEYWVEVGNSVAGTVRLNGAQTTLNSALVTASTVGLSVGSRISGPGIPADTTVVSLNSSTQFTMSAAAGASGTVDLLANTVSSLHAKTDIILPLSLPDDAGASAAASVSGTSVTPKILPAARLGNSYSIPYSVGLSTQAGVTIVYQWRKNGVALSDDGRITGTSTDTLNFSNVYESDEGAYDMVISKLSGGAEKSRITTRTLILPVAKPPVISGLAGALLARPGQKIVLSPTVQSGTAHLVCVWEKVLSGGTRDGAAVRATTDPFTGLFTIASAQITDSGTYELSASDDNGTRLPKPTITLTVAEPLSVTLSAGSLALEARSRLTLDAVVGGNGASGLSYQWRFNGVPIRGAVNSRFMVNSVLASNAGNYDVVVTNGTDRITSSSCVVTVQPPWRIETQPAASTLFNAGGTISLSVGLNRSDLANAKFQWVKGIGRAAQILADQTGATLTMPNAKFSDEGTYMVLITTSTGRLTSTL